MKSLSRRLRPFADGWRHVSIGMRRDRWCGGRPVGRDGSYMRLLTTIAVLAFAAATASQPPKLDDSLAERGLKEIDAKDAALRRAIRKASPSIVSIYLRERSEGFEQPFFDRDRRGRRGRGFEVEDVEVQAAAYGAGIVLDKSGAILTCYHLVRLAAAPNSKYDLHVRTHDGALHGVSRDDILAGDPRSDLAVIRISSVDPKAIVPATFGDGDKLFVGQTVLALGNAFGIGVDDGAVSASAGLISAIGRKALPILPSDVSGMQLFYERQKHLASWGQLIQVDCRLNLGTSGGALIDARGDVVGITMALAARAGMETPGGFALPYDTLVRRVVEKLRVGKEMEYGFLGVEPQNFTRTTAQESRNFPTDKGVEIRSVVLPATMRGGLQVKDVVIAIDGQPIRNSNDLVLKVGGSQAGQTLRFKVARPSRGEFEVLDLSVKLGKYPVAGPVIKTNLRPAFAGMRVDYLSLLSEEFRNNNLFDAAASALPNGGVMVLEVESNSPADLAGIAKNNVITSANGVNLDTPDDFLRVVQNAKAPVKLEVNVATQRAGATEWKPRTVELSPAKTKTKASKVADDN